MPLIRATSAFPARIRIALIVAPFVMAGVACGCHTNSESTRQTRAESISPAKDNDTALLASGSGGPSDGVITKASDAAGLGTANPPATQTASTTSTGSRWTNFFSRKETPDRVVLPRNDQEGDNGPLDGSAEKTAANEF